MYNITEGCLGTQPADLPKDYLKNTLNNFTEEWISFIILSKAVKPLCSVWRDNLLLSARSLLIKEKKCCTVVLLAEVHPANTEKYHLGLWQTGIFEALWYWSSPVVAQYPLLIIFILHCASEGGTTSFSFSLFLVGNKVGIRSLGCAAVMKHSKCYLHSVLPASFLSFWKGIK